MKYPEAFLRRRAILMASVSAGLLLHPALADSAGLIGIDALDSPAIPVKAPTRAVLVAITLAGNRIVAAGEHGVIIYSDDAGKTWEQASVPIDTTLTCVAFVSPLIGWSAGHFGVILATGDGGKTWQLQLNGIQANHLTLVAAQQADAQNSTVPGAAFALRRANHFVEEGPDKPFLTLLVFSSQKVMVFGAYRLAMITTDGGRTWADWSLHIYDRLSHNIYEANKIGLNIYLVGEAGLVFRSTDNGNTFLPLTPASDVTLLGIVGTNPDSLVVFGVAGAAFRSTDQGKSWVPLNVATEDDITAGCILESGAILLVSETGAFLLSKDNGATFQTVPGVQPISTFDVIEVPDNELVVVGGAGVTIFSAAILNT